MLAVGAVVALAGIGAIIARVVTERDDAAPTTVPTSSTAAPESTVPVTLAPTDLVRVEEVWLVDRDDGVFDWGVTVLTPVLAPARSGIEIEVRLFDDEDDIVVTEVRTVDGVDEDSVGAAIGQVVEPETPPVRIEFDITVGEASNDDAFDELLEMRGLVRRDDEVSGRVRARKDRRVVDVVAVLVWRDDDDEVVGMALQTIDEVRPGDDAEFTLDLDGLNVPDGRPDDVFWVSAN